MHFARNGIVDPDELVLLRDVLEEQCRQLKVAIGSPDCENVAGAILRAFRSGVRDRIELLNAAKAIRPRLH